MIPSAMSTRSFPVRFTALSMATIGVLWLACESTFSSTVDSGATLPRSIMVPLGEVSRFFPDITRKANAGRNPTAVGKPSATRIVVYRTGDGSKKVTLTVDRYDSLSAASSAYRQAVEGSRAAPGFKPLSVPTVGQQTFAGTSAVGAESHIGMGALDRRLIIGATLAGYDVTPENIAKLIAIARMQVAAAKQAAGAPR